MFLAAVSCCLYAANVSPVSSCRSLQHSHIFVQHFPVLTRCRRASLYLNTVSFRRDFGHATSLERVSRIHCVRKRPAPSEPVGAHFPSLNDISYLLPQYSCPRMNLLHPPATTNARLSYSVTSISIPTRSQFRPHALFRESPSAETVSLGSRSIAVVDPHPPPSSRS